MRAYASTHIGTRTHAHIHTPNHPRLLCQRKLREKHNPNN